MAEQQYKRNTAYKLRIGDILVGKPIFDNDKFLYMELGDKKISRVNVIGNIVDKYETEGERNYKPKQHYLGGDFILKQTVNPEPGYAVKQLFFTQSHCRISTRSNHRQKAAFIFDAEAQRWCRKTDSRSLL